MELEDFGTVFAPGPALSVEERSALEVQIAKKRVEEKLQSMRFWGRVQGTTGDYFVVCGTLTTSEFPARKWFFATTRDLTLKQLPELTPEFAAKAEALASSRFVGNPGKLLGADADAGEAEEELDEEGNPKPGKARFSEGHRLAATVAAIDRETGVVPVGSYTVTPTHHVVTNAGFGGLSESEAGALSSYAHFRPAEHPSRAGALAKASVVPGDNFLDPLSEDTPEGIWSVQVDSGRGVARVSSLKWPGYFAFHAVGSPRHGAVYVGDGRPAEIQYAL